MDKLERLTNLLLALLESRRPMTMRELVDGVEGYPPGDAACRQAFERDKRTLREEGVPLETVTVEERGQRVQAYRVRPDQYYLPELGLTSEEQAALNLAVAAVRLDTGSGRDALWKLGGAEYDRAPPLAALPALPALPVLHEAMRTRAPVRFRYRGRNRWVDPYGMGFRHGFWYLVANDRDRGELRTYRVDRMEGRVEPDGHGAFEVPAGFDLATGLPDEPWRIGEGTGEEEVLRADVLIDRVRAPLVEAELGVDAIAERRDDGAVVVTLEVTNRAAFRSWVLGFLDHAEVLGPPELRAEVVAWLQAAGSEGDRAPA
ncbi:MAG TPA: WYL domain-containing protein [Acidimicrobiales bacterium]|nr:WYL domain-containing protein [Acidimicrobiales bacterium]